MKAAYEADRLNDRRSRRCRSGWRREYARQNIPLPRPASWLADKTSRRARQGRARRDWRRATRWSPAILKSDAGEERPLHAPTDRRRHAFSNGTVRVDLRSNQEGTVNPLLRKNSGLNSLV